MTDLAVRRPQLAVGVRLHWDSVRERHVLLFPEGALALNPTAAEVLALCDGQRTLEEISEVLSVRYDGAAVHKEVASLLDSIAERGLVVDAEV
jgi:pyrroloquinoline quinone biosynthesis protein D